VSVLVAFALAWLAGAVLRHRQPHEFPHVAAAPPANEPSEAALRGIVSHHFIATGYWAPGGVNPYTTRNRFRVLVPPGEIIDIYKRNLLWTLCILKRIIETGSPADAHAAIAYAHAAVGYANDDPVPLITSHGYAFYPTAKEFDEVTPLGPETHRQCAVEQ